MFCFVLFFILPRLEMRINLVRLVLASFQMNKIIKDPHLVTEASRYKLNWRHGEGKSVSVLIFLDSKPTLYSCSACAQPSAHAGTSDLPEGPAGAEPDTALPEFQCSFLPLPNRKGQDFFSLVTPTSSVAQPGFHYIISFLQK